jgi:hypothetical protein
MGARVGTRFAPADRWSQSIGKVYNWQLTVENLPQGKREKMARPPKRQDIDHVLRHWDYDPSEISVRLVESADGREVLQMRVELGVLQLEVEDRPDGTRPGGAESYYDYLLGLALHEGDGFTMTDEHCAEADREFIQYYHRRICWLALREYRRAVKDADHNLAFMDFAARHSTNREWLSSHEQYRPFILFHRTQAAALAELEDVGPESAIREVNQGIERIRAHFDQMGDDEAFENDEMVGRLVELREALRDQYHVGPTLEEQLAEAVAAEEYERAAQLRDQIARRSSTRA